MEYISTTELANDHDIKPADLFEKLKSIGWIERNKDNKWSLTEIGKKNGGKMRQLENGGEFVVWPENISLLNGQQQQTNKTKLINATALGKHFNISSQRLNLILSELGWLEKDIAGWEITKLGKTVGGKQFEHETSGGFYVMWPQTILENKSLLSVFNATQAVKDNTKQNPAPTQQRSTSPTQTFSPDNFREKFEAKHRTKDGHYVRSRAEVIIDDTLYDYGLVHAYEKKVPIEEDLYTDFYLPNGKVYIEFWGLENDHKYLERKKKKIELYQKYELKLIELNDSDILNLDDHLPKKLLKFGIKVY